MESTVKNIVLLLFLCSITISSSNLDEMMKLYKKAPQSQRYKLMNKIKMEIAKLQKEKQLSKISNFKRMLKNIEQNHQKE